MSTPTELPNRKLLTVLQESYFESVFAARKPRLQIRLIEQDRRKHRKILRELVNAGLVQENHADGETDYEILPSVLRSLQAAPCNICKIWQNAFESRTASSVSLRPWIRHDVLSPNQKRHILESDHYDFFVVAREAYSDWGSLAPEPRTVLERTRQKYLQYWDGPFKRIADAWSSVGRNYELLIVVSSEELREFAAKRIADRKFEKLYLDNLLWGLVVCGIVDKRVVFDENDAPRLDQQLRERALQPALACTYANVDHESWQENLESSIANLTTGIERMNLRLTTLRQISASIVQFGGLGEIQA